MLRGENNKEKWKGRQPPGIKPRTLGLCSQCSGTELQQPDNHQSSQFSICTAQVVCLSCTLGSHSVCAVRTPIGVDWKMSPSPLRAQAGTVFIHWRQTAKSMKPRRKLILGILTRTPVVNIWKEWSAHCCKVCTSFTKWPTHLLIMEPLQLDYWLSKFGDHGDHYPPDTLYSICSGLLRYIWETRPQINVFKDPILLLFAGFQRTLHSEMKRLCALGLGVKKQAEPITIEEEKARFGRRASWETQTLNNS